MQRDLVLRARDGDYDAFTALAAGSLDRLHRIARLILRSDELAADAVQEALLAAWLHIRAVRDPDRFDAWIHRLLVRACIDEARRVRRHRVDVELTDLSYQSVDGAESVVVARDQLERGFLRLDPEMRAVIVLHHYLDLPLPTVAATLGIPLGTAKSRLHRALGLMRAALDADSRVGQATVEGRPA